ncbi:MAG: HD-GYP domain-containing protein [Candidatus Aminicenantes bacterium]|nr:HD-GYP domain-containing protein [Candidatus Aminicenantes bacterium]
MPETERLPRRLEPEKEGRLFIEDRGGARSAFPLSLSQNEYLFALRGNEDFLGSPAGGDRYSSWNGLSTRFHRIFMAKEAMRDLSHWYEQIFRERDELDESSFAEKQRFFNSNLIQFIAATDDNEDTVGHSQFVANYTLLLARELGIEDQKYLVDLERGALLHDIGKIGIPESILKKKGPLTTIEREIIKDHPLLGFKLIEGFSFLDMASQVVLYHHEQFAGGGYPYGLAGEKIPLEARLFSIADTVDAITSDRPYRKGQSFEEARREIERHSGRQFDPELVEVFLSIPQDRWQKAKLDTLRTLRLPTIH